MAIRQYVERGQTLWKVYINIRSTRNQTIRAQKLIVGLKSETEALIEEKKWIKKLTEDVAHLASKGLTWEQLLDRWELSGRDNPHGIHKLTHESYVAALRRWTNDWTNLLATEISVGHVRAVFEFMDFEGVSKSFMHTLKAAMNAVFKWGIEERLLPFLAQSPAQGFEIKKKSAERLPQALTLDQMRSFLFEAKVSRNPWYPIWAMALLTGMRNGELFALRWKNVDLDSNRIMVSESYNARGKMFKDTKSGHWRTVPISTQLREVLLELKDKNPSAEFVLPRVGSWHKGIQARELRIFLLKAGLPQIRFHDLRACFATQLLAHNVAPAVVMKICGWREWKTMQLYMRIAGIDERGATEVLKLTTPDQDYMGKVVSIFDFKGKNE